MTRRTAQASRFVYFVKYEDTDKWEQHSLDCSSSPRVVKSMPRYRGRKTGGEEEVMGGKISTYLLRRVKGQQGKRAAWLGSWDDVPGGMMTGCWGGTGALCDALFC
uniref:Uncharacterized protein n=1 Tax=Pyricularia oryzae (strain P131) TaxID=1143193 RepID=L7JKT3_PYRO1